jgi:hypothetical protein
MSKVRFLLLGAGAVLALGTAGVLASVGAVTLTNSDSHGDTVASAARETCPRGPNGVHGQCVSAIASSKSESESTSDTTCTANANDTTEDASETKATSTEDTAEKTANPTKSADKKENKTEKSAAKAEDKSERKACEAPEAPEAPEAAD